MPDKMVEFIATVQDTGEPPNITPHFSVPFTHSPFDHSRVLTLRKDSETILCAKIQLQDIVIYFMKNTLN